jgi:hypothetical protein
MAAATTYLVRSYVLRGHKLVAEPDQVFTEQRDAIHHARHLAAKKAGAAVLAQSPDADELGLPEEAVVLFTAGRVPSELLDEN